MHDVLNTKFSPTHPIIISFHFNVTKCL